MTQYGIPSSYIGTEAVVLAIALFIMAAVIAYLGTRLHHPVGVQKTGTVAGILLLVVWILSFLAFSTAGLLYYVTAAQQFGNITPPTNPISPITGLLVLVTFVGITFLSRHHGLKAALGSAIVGTMAAPMFFELPFDLITIWKNHPPEPALLFNMILLLPVLAWEIASFALLTWSPWMRISKYTLFSLGGMFFVFAVWAVFGFSYPSSPLPFSLNVISKVLSFVVSVTLLLPQEIMDSKLPSGLS